MVDIKMLNFKLQTYSIPLDILKALDEYIMLTGMKKSTLVARALEEYLQRHKIDDKPVKQ